MSQEELYLRSGDHQRSKLARDSLRCVLWKVRQGVAGRGMHRADTDLEAGGSVLSHCQRRSDGDLEVF